MKKIDFLIRLFALPQKKAIQWDGGKFHVKILYQTEDVRLWNHSFVFSLWKFLERNYNKKEG